MSASYPGAIYSPRTHVNKTGSVYDPLQTTKLFAEDVNNPDNEIVAVETELGINPKGSKASVVDRLDDVDEAIAALGTPPAVCTGAEINTGTNNTKFASPKAIADSDVAFLSDIPAVPVKATGAEINTGTDDAKFATAKAIADSTVSKSAKSETLTNKTIGDDMLLDENAGIKLDSALSATGKYCGITEAGTLGCTAVFGNLMYLNDNDSRWELVDANLSDGYDKKLAICLTAGNDGDASKFLLFGKVRADSLFPTFTIGAPSYMSETAGEIVVGQPTTSDACIRIVGFGNTADELYFCPSPDYIVHL